MYSPEWAKVYSLFGYEVDGGRKSLFWQKPWYFSQNVGQAGKQLDESFAAWKATKRFFTIEEILSGTWIKIGDHGYSYSVTFFPDETFDEISLFDATVKHHGVWKQEGTMIRTNVLEYELYIMANKTGAIHSGVECVGGKQTPDTYFKIIHLL